VRRAIAAYTLSAGTVSCQHGTALGSSEQVPREIGAESREGGDARCRIDRRVCPSDRASCTIDRDVYTIDRDANTIACAIYRIDRERLPIGGALGTIAVPVRQAAVPVRQLGPVRRTTQHEGLRTQAARPARGLRVSMPRARNSDTRRDMYETHQSISQTHRSARHTPLRGRDRGVVSARRHHARTKAGVPESESNRPAREPDLEEATRQLPADATGQTAFTTRSPFLPSDIERCRTDLSVGDIQPLVRKSGTTQYESDSTGIMIVARDFGIDSPDFRIDCPDFGLDMPDSGLHSPDFGLHSPDFGMGRW
jgi:hypothetical protein